MRDDDEQVGARTGFWRITLTGPVEKGREPRAYFPVFRSEEVAAYVADFGFDDEGTLFGVAYLDDPPQPSRPIVFRIERHRFLLPDQPVPGEAFHVLVDLPACEPQRIAVDVRGWWSTPGLKGRVVVIARKEPTSSDEQPFDIAHEVNLGAPQTGFSATLPTGWSVRAAAWHSSKGLWIAGRAPHPAGPGDDYALSRLRQDGSLDPSATSVFRVVPTRRLSVLTKLSFDTTARLVASGFEQDPRTARLLRFTV